MLLGISRLVNSITGFYRCLRSGSLVPTPHTLRGMYRPSTRLGLMLLGLSWGMKQALFMV